MKLPASQRGQHMVENFAFTGTPKIYFGPGEFERLKELVLGRAKKVLLVTGAISFRSSPHWDTLLRTLSQSSINVFDYALSGEPSPGHVDTVVADVSKYDLDLVVAIGGGSVIDLGKAISAMLPLNSSALDYLEKVGTKTHSGKKIPFIAVPTTAGTGSEATTNAVLGKVGKHGFKKSLRHDNFMPDVAIVDPELTFGCPPAVTAACGLDAITQLLESYVSTGATPITDALARSGLISAREAFMPTVCEGADDIKNRSSMAYAALTSGITLANAGLGIVHGIASSIGGYFEIPHGMFCGTMVGAATEMTIEKLRNKDNADSLRSLKKYAEIGYLFTDSAGDDLEQGCQLLTRTLNAWVNELNIPRLSQFGVTEGDLGKIVAGAGNKNNPCKLSTSDITELLQKRL